LCRREIAGDRVPRKREFCLRYVAADRQRFSEKLGLWAFWFYNDGLVLWILLNFFPIGWA